MNVSSITSSTFHFEGRDVLSSSSQASISSSNQALDSSVTADQPPDQSVNVFSVGAMIHSLLFPPRFYEQNVSQVMDQAFGLLPDNTTNADLANNLRQGFESYPELYEGMFYESFKSAFSTELIKYQHFGSLNEQQIELFISQTAHTVRCFIRQKLENECSYSDIAKEINDLLARLIKRNLPPLLGMSSTVLSSATHTNNKYTQKAQLQGKYLKRSIESRFQQSILRLGASKDLEMPSDDFQKKTVNQKKEAADIDALVSFIEGTKPGEKKVKGKKQPPAIPIAKKKQKSQVKAAIKKSPVNSVSLPAAEKEENVLLPLPERGDNKFAQLQQKLFKISPITSLWRVTRKWVPLSGERLKSNLEETYHSLSEEELLFERAKHFLPALDRVISERTARRVYSFITDRGVGLFCNLLYNHKKIFGIVYYGIHFSQTKKTFIFHRYFSETPIEKISQANIPALKKDLLKAESVSAEELNTSAEEGWVSSIEDDLQVNADATVSIVHPANRGGHKLTVYPIHPELL